VKGASYHPLHDPYLTAALAAPILVFVIAALATPVLAFMYAMPDSRHA
jgi:hypothetical protein